MLRFLGPHLWKLWQWGGGGVLQPISILPHPVSMATRHLHLIPITLQRHHPPHPEAVGHNSSVWSVLSGGCEESSSWKGETLMLLARGLSSELAANFRVAPSHLCVPLRAHP